MTFMEENVSRLNLYSITNSRYMGKENPASDTLLGYALDGFPIYGPIKDPESLDTCNGRTIDGEYRYHVLVSNIRFCFVQFRDFQN